MSERYYLAIDAGEFIGTFIVYDAPTREEVERYRDALFKPIHGRDHMVGVSVVDQTCWYAWFHDALMRYRHARKQASGGRGQA